MKIGVINFSSNVGKSTIARHLLSPRMGNARILAVESINSDGTDEEAIRGKQFGELSEALAVLDDVVVDIGASNVEDFISRMKQYRGSHEDFDYFIVPAVGKPKQQRDTISTVDALADLGVPPHKIRVVFNMVEADEAPERLFAGLFEYHSAEHLFTLRPAAVVSTNDVYGRLRASSQSISEILDDPTDLKAMLKAAADPEEKLRVSRRIALRRLAAGATEELDAVFAALLS